MINDGKCYLWLPSFLTLSTLSAEAATAINQVHTALGLPGTEFVEGGQNPYILLLNDLDMGGAPFTRGRGSELAVCGPIENQSFLTVQYVTLLTAFNGNVEGLPVWFEIDDIAAVCPFGDGEETWETWGTFGESHVPVQIGSKWYRSNCVGQSGTKLYASDWVPQYMQGLTVLTADEYVAIQQADQ